MIGLLTAFFLWNGDANYVWWILWIVISIGEFTKHIRDNT